jgi:hypothetical protein
LGEQTIGGITVDRIKKTRRNMTSDMASIPSCLVQTKHSAKLQQRLEQWRQQLCCNP